MILLIIAVWVGFMLGFFFSAVLASGARAERDVYRVNRRRSLERRNTKDRRSKGWGDING